MWAPPFLSSLLVLLMQQSLERLFPLLCNPSGDSERDLPTCDILTCAAPEEVSELIEVTLTPPSLLCSFLTHL